MLLPSRNQTLSTIFAPHPRSLTFFPYPIFYESTQNSIECSTINHEPRSARGDGAARVTKWRAVPLGSTTRPNAVQSFSLPCRVVTNRASRMQSQIYLNFAEAMPIDGGAPVTTATTNDSILLWYKRLPVFRRGRHRWHPYNYAPSRSTNSAFPRFPAFPTFPTFPGH